LKGLALQTTMTFPEDAKVYSLLDVEVKLETD